MSDDPPSVLALFTTFEGLVAAGDPVKLARVPAINFHVLGGEPSRWSLVGHRQPRFMPGFVEGANTLVTCDARGLASLVRDKQDSTAKIEVIGDFAGLSALAEALPRPWSWLEAQSGH